jgi:hypothetical protein
MHVLAPSDFCCLAMCVQHQPEMLFIHAVNLSRPPFIGACSLPLFGYLFPLAVVSFPATPYGLRFLLQVAHPAAPTGLGPAGVVGNGLSHGIAASLQHLGVMVYQIQHQQVSHHAHVVAGLQAQSLASTLQGSHLLRDLPPVRPVAARQPSSEAEARRNRTEATKAASRSEAGQGASALGSDTTNNVPNLWVDWKGLFKTVDSEYILLYCFGLFSCMCVAALLGLYAAYDVLSAS